MNKRNTDALAKVVDFNINIAQTWESRQIKIQKKKLQVLLFSLRLHYPQTWQKLF